MVVANAVAAWIYGAGVNNGMLPGIGEWLVMSLLRLWWLVR
jgi:hypothetical protein